MSGEMPPVPQFREAVRRSLSTAVGHDEDQGQRRSSAVSRLPTASHSIRLSDPPASATLEEPVPGLEVATSSLRDFPRGRLRWSRSGGRRDAGRVASRRRPRVADARWASKHVPIAINGSRSAPCAMSAELMSLHFLIASLPSYGHLTDQCVLGHHLDQASRRPKSDMPHGESRGSGDGLLVQKKKKPPS